MAEWNFFTNEDNVWDTFVVSDHVDSCLRPDSADYGFGNDNEQRVDDSDIGAVVAQSSLDTVNNFDGLNSRQVQVDDGDIAAVVNSSLRPPTKDCANFNRLECMERSSLLSQPLPDERLQESIPVCHGQQFHDASTAGCLHEATSIQQLHNVMNTMDVGIRWHISRSLYRWAGSTIPSRLANGTNTNIHQLDQLVANLLFFRP